MRKTNMFKFLISILLLVSIVFSNVIVFAEETNELKVTKEIIDEKLIKMQSELNELFGEETKHEFTPIEGENAFNHKVTHKVFDEWETIEAKVTYEITDNFVTFKSSAHIDSKDTSLNQDKLADIKNGLIDPLFGYPIIASLYDIDISNAQLYIGLAYLSDASKLTKGHEPKNRYTIYSNNEYGSGSVSLGATEEKAVKHLKVDEDKFYTISPIYMHDYHVDLKIDDKEKNGIYEIDLSEENYSEESVDYTFTCKVSLDDESWYKEKLGYEYIIFENDGKFDKFKEDYVINLKVGQKGKITVEDEIKGYQVTGDNCRYYRTNKESQDLEFEAIKPGTSKGAIRFKDNTYKIFTINVTELEEDENVEDLDPQIIKVDNKNARPDTEIEGNKPTPPNPDKPENKPEEKPETKPEEKPETKPESKPENKPSNNNNNNNNSNSKPKDDTLSNNRIPNAGASFTLGLLLISSLVLITYYGIKLNKYKDFK